MGFEGHPYILRKDSQDDNLTPAKTFLVVFMAVINVFMFLGNLLSIVTICSTPKLRRQVSYWFVMNLAIIDFIISITVVPLNTIWEYYGTWPFSRITCEFFTFADIAFSTISAYSIVLVSLDKYIFITYSIHYFEKMTRKIAVILIVGVWVFVFIFSIISLLTEVGTDENFKDHFLLTDNDSSTCIFVMTDMYVIPSAIISFFIPFIILCFTSSRIVCIASRHIRKIHSVPQTFTISSDTDSDGVKIFLTKTKPPNVVLTAISPLAHPEEHVRAQPEQEDDANHTHIDHIRIQTHDSTDLNEKAGHTETSFYTSLDHAQNTPEKDDAIMQSDNTEYHQKPITELDTIQESFTDEKDTFEKELNGLCTLRKIRSQSFPRSDSLKSSSSPKGQTNVKRSNSLKVNNLRKADSLRSLAITKSESSRSVRVNTTKRSRYCKLFGTITIVIVCFIVMFAPFNIAITIDVWCHCVHPWVYEDILAVLYYMHSLVNPYIYMATDRRYKAALRVMWTKFHTIFWNKQKL
ncbi:tyramine receptor tyra-2-like [Mya arenaria]|uniref:tyramine receptor tyra-2-like n=1 Tax=Mya arenaria TaxID=6604 RepID=UPI0022E74CFE|nr:tyramine receptor tyra-2-like [Mya arenaria]